MRLDQEFNPSPKIIDKRPKKKKKKMETHKGVKIPPRKVRGAISKTDYQKALEYHGGCCAETGRTDNIEMHHVVFKSQGGRGSWRNLVPLTRKYHEKCHRDYTYAEAWRDKQKERHGKWFYTDKFDLWKQGIINRPTDELFERFMRGDCK